MLVLDTVKKRWHKGLPREILSYVYLSICRWQMICDIWYKSDFLHKFLSLLSFWPTLLWTGWEMTQDLYAKSLNVFGDSASSKTFFLGTSGSCIHLFRSHVLFFGVAADYLCAWMFWCIDCTETYCIKENWKKVEGIQEWYMHFFKNKDSSSLRVSFGSSSDCC